MTDYGYNEEQFQELNRVLGELPSFGDPHVDRAEYNRKSQLVRDRNAATILRLQAIERLHYHRLEYRRARLASLVKGTTDYEQKLRRAEGAFRRFLRSYSVPSAVIPREENWTQPPRVDTVRTTPEYKAIKQWAKGRFYYSDGWRVDTFRAKDTLSGDVLFKILQLRTGAYLEEATRRKVLNVKNQVNDRDMQAEYLELVRGIRPDLEGKK